MTPCTRHALDERCLLCCSDVEFETVMSDPTATFPLASAEQECPTWLPAVAS